MNPLTELTLDQLRARRSAKWQTYPSDVLPMFIAEMDTPLAPPVAQVLAESIDLGDTGYATAGRLGAAYADFAARRHGWAPDPASMQVVADILTGICEVIRAVTVPGDAVVLDTPAYPPFFTKIRATARTIVQVPMQVTDAGYTPDLDGLDRAFAAGAKIYVLCNPHNPTGTVFSAATLESIAELAADHDVRVLADEVHGPLTYPGVRYVPFQTLTGPAAASAVSFVSASKAWNLAGLKAALTIPGPDAVAALAGMPEDLAHGAGLLGVLAGEVALTEGLPWLDQLMAGLEHNRTRLAARLSEELPEIGYRPPQATFLAWLDVRELGLGNDPTRTILDRGRLALNRGTDFGDPGTGFVRLNLAAHPEFIDEAVRRLKVAAGRR